MNHHSFTLHNFTRKSPAVPLIAIVALLLIVAVWVEAGPFMSGSQRRTDGGIGGGQPNRDPSGVTAADVDALMWPIVERINRSGWIWTTESCQGHEGGPELTLGIVTNDPGRFFAALTAAEKATDMSSAFERQNPVGLRLEVGFWRHAQVDPRYGQHQVRLSVLDPVQWPAGRAVFTKFAELVAP